MGARLYNTQKIVEKLLKEYPDTRGDNDLLYLKACKAVYPHIEALSFENAILMRKKLTLPSYVSVDRARRKLQESNPELRPSEDIINARYEEFKEYREYALS